MCIFPTNYGPDSAISFIVPRLSYPHDIFPLLLLLGGEIVQKALAQGTGNGLAPVCFSFGWVWYAFLSFANLLGDGRLMPPAEFPCKVYNMESGYVRENRNWVISRLLRDNELFMAKQQEDRPDLGRSLKIAIYEPSPLEYPGPPGRYSHLITTLAQFGVAIIPWIFYGELSTFLITVIGTLMVVVTGTLRQWRAEKLPEGKENKKTFAITKGNGSKDIMIIRNLGLSYDLEDLSTFESPRLRRAWKQCGIFRTSSDQTVNRDVDVRTFRGLPLDFWFTRIVCFALAAGWLLLLLLVAAMPPSSWYLLLVAALGMMQNIYVAERSLHPESQPISLILRGQILGNKVMDALMDLEVTLERDPLFEEVDRKAIVEPLLKEYFPGSLRKHTGEEAWWEGNRNQYDWDRLNNKTEDGLSRGVPRSRWFVMDPELEKVDTSSTDSPHEIEHGPYHEAQQKVPESFRTMVGETTQSNARHEGSHDSFYSLGITAGMT